MRRLFTNFLLGLVTFGTANAAVANAEPGFCDPKTFMKFKVPSSAPGLKAAHVFQIGDLVIAGLAVGDSEVAATEKLANQYARFDEKEKSCTWYYNDGNVAAADAFTQKYLSNPIWKSADYLAKQYSEVLEKAFDQEGNNFINCATRHRYVAMGCDGMKHRGPTVFAMFLAFAGCSPKNAVKIVENLWGHNLVNTSKRLAVAQKGYEMGQARPESRIALQTMLLR